MEIAVIHAEINILKSTYFGGIKIYLKKFVTCAIRFFQFFWRLFFEPSEVDRKIEESRDHVRRLMLGIHQK